VVRSFTTTAAIVNRMRELEITTRDLATTADVPEATPKYFVLLSRDPQTLERLSAALGWPRDHVARLWEV
jgi:hypothetical protein